MNNYMKIPEKFKGNQDFLTDEQVKINAIIDYLTEQWEEKQPCKVCVYKTEERDEYCIRCFKSRITPV